MMWTSSIDAMNMVLYDAFSNMMNKE